MKIFFIRGGGGGGGGGRGVEGRDWGIFNRKNNSIGSRLFFFCAHALYKISSSWLKWFSSLIQTEGVTDR